MNFQKNNVKDSESKISKFQKFETALIQRHLIKNAVYNPRIISDEARKKLKAKIKDIGLVIPLTWNKRTGNLVSGHQRISILDELERNKDYELTVAVIDVDEKTEKEMNVFLNNQSAMGEWDTEALDSLLKDVELNYENLGFNLLEIQTLCDNFKVEENIFSDFNDESKTDIEKLKEIRKTAKENNKNIDDCEFYFVVVCKSRTQVDEFLTKLNLSTDERYVDGLSLASQLGIKLN